MKTVGIKDLKNNLSAYLREVRRGTRILVSDRDTIVAELHEPGAVYSTSGGDDVILAGWVADAHVLLPRHTKEPLPDSPVKRPAGTSARLLADDRGESA
jgi:antitoxin (DNA-binding transcriptional repressor) of toxin-antitoxin stability system